MTKRKKQAKKYVYRGGGCRNRTFSMSRVTLAGMQEHPAVNWSAVVDSYIKVYLFDLNTQKDATT